MVKKNKLAKNRQDSYYWQAKEQGYRSRAAYKLIQMDRKYDLLGSSQCVIDLCAAPGGWMQVCKKLMPVSSMVIGVDLVQIASIPGAVTIISDIKTSHCTSELKKVLNKRKADLILNDGAPNVGGTWDKDSYDQIELSLYALKLAVNFLRPGGSFVTKVFRSRDYPAFLDSCRHFFKNVKVTKPHSSRGTSAEIYVICKSFDASKDTKSEILDPKFVFQMKQELPKPLNVFKMKERKNKDGYDRDLLAVRSATAMEFVTSKKPEELLANVAVIDFDEESLTAFEDFSIDEEIKALCKDLLVLNKGDFKRLIKWKKKAEKYLKTQKTITRKKEDNAHSEKISKEEENEAVMEEKGDIQKSCVSQVTAEKTEISTKVEDELNNKEKDQSLDKTDKPETQDAKDIINKEEKDEALKKNDVSENAVNSISDDMKKQQIVEKIEKKLKTQRRKAHKEKMKNLKRLKKTERIVSSDDELFTLSSRSRYKNENTTSNLNDEANTEKEKEKVGFEDDSRNENEEISIEYSVKSKDAYLEDQEEYFDRLYESYKENKERIEKEINPNLTLEKNKNASLKGRKNSKKTKNEKILKKQLLKSSDKNLSWFSSSIFKEFDQKANYDGEDESFELKTNNESQPQEENLSQFAGEGEDIKEDSDSESEFGEESLTEGEPPCENGLSSTVSPNALHTKKESDDLYNRLSYREEKKLKNKKRAKTREKRLIHQNEVHQGTKELEEIVEKKRKEKIEKKKQKGEGTGQDVHEKDKEAQKLDRTKEKHGFVEVALEEDSSSEMSSDPEAIAETLAIGKALQNKRRREEILDNASSRVFLDHKNLPDWFVDDERENFTTEKPVSRREVETFKSQISGVDSKFLKSKSDHKRQEALARRKTRRRRNFEKIKTKMNNVINSQDLTNKRKTIEIEKLSKQGLDKKKRVVYQISKKGGRVKSSKKKVPKGAKIKLVDRRMKADKRTKKVKKMRQKRRRKR